MADEDRSRSARVIVTDIKSHPAGQCRAFEIALAKFPEKTQEQVAEQVGCGQQYVGKVQSELTHSGKLAPPKTRKGKDGKTRKTTYSKKSVKTNSPSGSAKPQSHETHSSASAESDAGDFINPPTEPERISDDPPHVQSN